MHKKRCAITLAALAIIVLTLPVSAGKLWCQRDPIVRLNGTDTHILVAVPEQYAALVNGPVQIEISTPAGVTREVTFIDAGFNGLGEVITFTDRAGKVSKQGKFSVQVRVRVPIDRAAAQ